MSTEVILGVGGMTCNGCVNNVKNAVNGISGVSTVVVDLGSSQATIIIDENGNLQPLKDSIVDIIDKLIKVSIVITHSYQAIQSK